MAEREKGKGFAEAAIEAASLRFRPILMTAISSIVGFLPLVIASGAGAASQQAIGVAVVGGMVAATVMSLLFTPVFYVVMQRLGGQRKKAPQKGQQKGQKIAADAKPALQK
jgi:HAE1 family hydrophobic/amphiphilic exporter-1